MKQEPDKAIGDALNALRSLDRDALTEGTLRDLAQRFDVLRVLLNMARDYADELTESIAATMEADTETITGVGVLTRKKRTSSAWLDDDARDRMYDDAARAIIQKVAIDPMTGEVHPPLANAVRETWRLVQESFSLGADPKAGFRKVLGLQPDIYRSKYATGFTVAITEETL